MTLRTPRALCRAKHRSRMDAMDCDIWVPLALTEHSARSARITIIAPSPFSADVDLAAAQLI